MKTLKTILAIVLSALIALSIYSVLQDQNYKKKKAAWEAETAERVKRIAALEKELLKQTTTATEWRKKADETAAESVKLRNLLSQEKLAHARDLAKVAEMAPDAIVIETRYYLQVAPQEIMLKADGIQFTIHAGRKNIGSLKTLDFTLKKEVPRLELIITTKDTEIGDLRTSLQSAFNAMDLQRLDIE